MNRLALNFICKNERDCILLMLESSRPITDLIVAVDTGSTDDTISLIYEFGKKYNIPTHVFERPFDNFCNSRNYALHKLTEVIQDLHWDPEITWGFFIDCDETMEFSGNFSKQDLALDLYIVLIVVEQSLRPRQLFFRLSKNFVWEGPIHERIKVDDPSIIRPIVEGIRIIVKPVGASWKGDIEKKYLNYADKLTDYVNQGNRSYPWIYYLGECYIDAAHGCLSTERRKYWLLKAQKYFMEAASLESNKRNVKYLLNYRIAENKLELRHDWNEIQEFFLRSYAADKRYAEPFYKILRNYIQKGQWQIAYLFSSFAVANYHGKIPGDNDVTEVSESIYQWKLLLYHSFICTNSGRLEESRTPFLQLKNMLIEHPEYFNNDDIRLVQANLRQINLIYTKVRIRSLFKRFLPNLHKKQSKNA